MDRLPRLFAAGGLGLLMVSAGCRATRPEVPPGRPFAKDGQQRKAIEFSSDGHPVSAASSASFMPNNLGGSNMASGIGSKGTRPEGASFGAPPGAYGPPGTSGMGPPPDGTSDPATSRASGPPTEMPPPGLPPMDAPPAASPPPPEVKAAPTRNALPDPSQVVQPAVDAPGSMGAANQLPSPM